MAKLKAIYCCTACGAQAPKWAGQCSDCGAWNSFTEELYGATQPLSAQKQKGYAGLTDGKLHDLTDVNLQEDARLLTGCSELDRVLGGGLVIGSIVLLGGDPGIGKSTLLLQTLSHLSQTHATLYITGEESLKQVALRAKRLDAKPLHCKLMAETQIELILAAAHQYKPHIMVIDSIQTVFTSDLASAAGSVSQVRESTARLVQLAKQANIAIFLVGHVTKEGALAGPRVLEHMVDSVLYFEGDSNSRFRVIRASKNRFGAVNELGIFAMTEKGLKTVNNPSALFLSNHQQAVAGSCVMVSWEGSRPFLVEVQALVDESHLGNPRRVAVGLDSNRLAMLLAVLHRHGGIATHDQDVFINVVGGVKIAETGADTATLLAIVSSLRNKALPEKLVTFGEVGLAGEIRPVLNGQERLKDAAKHGFQLAIIPKANAPKGHLPGLKILAVEHLSEVIQAIRDNAW